MKKFKSLLLLGALSLVTLCGATNAPQTDAKKLTLKAELERDVLLAGKAQSALIKITITAPELQIEANQRKVKVNLAIVLDKSGSMNHSNKIEKAKEAAITALKMLGPQDIFSLVVYDTEVRTLVPATLVKNKAALIEQIQSIRADGSTALFAGVSVGANEVRKNRGERYINRIILLSDGLANVGPSTPAELGRLGASLIKEGISVSTVGVGGDYNEDLMTELSQNSDGNFYFVENSNDLPMIFSKELGSALSVVAKSVNIRISCPDGIKPQGILGHQAQIKGNDINMFFNQVYGGHTKSLLLQVELPPGTPNSKVNVANIDLNYQDINSGKRKELQQVVAASFSHDRNKVMSSYNGDVLTNAALIQNAIIKEQAIKEADKGNITKANILLNKAAEQLEQVADLTNDEKVKKEAEQNRKQAKSIEENKGLEKTQRKRMKGQNYQQINDQLYQQKSKY